MLLLALLLVAAFIIAWGTRAWSTNRRADTASDRLSLAANVCEAAARNVFGVDLDHSLASLATLDRIVGKDFADHVTDDTVYVLGAYLGDVMRNELGATWRKIEDGDKHPKLLLKNGDVFDPFDIVTAKLHFPEINLEQEVRGRMGDPHPSSVGVTS